MIPVQAIRRGAQGAAAANLQDVLLYWLGRQSALLDLDTLIKELTRLLTIERRDSVYKDSTVRTVTFFQQQMASRFQLKASGDVDDATTAALNQVLGELGAAGFGKSDAVQPSDPKSPAFTVSGTVKLADGTPASGIIVQAFDCDLRSQELLGKSQSDNSGAYKIGCAAAQFAKGESDGADLVVKALDAKGAVLVASPILFNAPPQAVVDLTIPADIRAPPTLFERISAALPPVLGTVKIEELEENQQYQDLTFLAGETGFAKADLARFVIAQLSASLGIQAEFWFTLLGGSLFAYDGTESIKTQFTALLDSFPGVNAGSVRKALAGAFDRKDIPAPLQTSVEGWVASFLTIAARLAVRSDTPPTFAKQTLDAAGIKDAAKQEKFALLLNQYGSVTPDLLTALKSDPSFAPAEIADISASYQLADLTGGNFTVVSSIKSAFRVNDPSQIRGLAAKSETEWVDLVTQQAAAGKINIPAGIGQPAGASPIVASISNAELYGQTLANQFRDAFPTTAFAGGLSRALSAGSVSGFQNGPALNTFLQKNPDFDLLTTPVGKYLDNAAIKDDVLRSDLMATQRVFKLADNFDASNTLLRNGLNSAQRVYRQGRAEFVAQYSTQPGFTAATADLAWSSAAATHAAVLTVVGQLIALDPGGLPAAMQSAGAQVTDFPDWNNLFQAGDLCDCEDCRSVLSPAAYFADLLTFLKDRRNKDNSGSVKDVLFKRRPDLGYLELNCDNALTPLPYIDIVCEVLEAVIAQGASDVPLTGFTAMPSSNAESAVVAALATAGLDPGADFSLAQVDTSDPNRWVVHGDVTSYLLSKTGTAPFSARILWNTKASAEELRAYPAYVDQAAYTTLSGAVYPFNLPFDLFAEEVRASFRKCNLQRWDLMRTLQAPGTQPAPTDSEIAAEYFGIGMNGNLPIDEKRLILAADTSTNGAATQAAWGETGNSAWLAKLANVKNFLDKSGLEFEELLALLDLKFVNPFDSSGTAREIVLQRPTPSCDTDTMTLAGLGAANLDRIHRFLRLWRKLGWKMWEVDFAIHQPALGGGSLDEPFLINLYWLCRLRTRLGEKTSIEQMCALLGDLNTETSFTEAYKKRTDGIYQSLFLNKRLVQPIDDAYDVASVTTGTPPQIAAHLPVLLGALRISETDLGLFQALTKASDNSLYITGDLTLGNISFLWRHVWLSRQLKLAPAEWLMMLKLGQQDIAQFSTPQAAFAFVERIDFVKASGFTPDQLDWLLAADLSAKAATNVTTTARFLASLRKGLQAIAAQYSAAQYPFLSPPSDLASLTALLTSLLLQLGRDAAAAQFFVDTLDGALVQEQIVTGLPETFAFPAILNGTANGIGIRYEPALVFNGSMTNDQLSILQSDISLSTVTSLPVYQQAITQLHDAPGKPAMVALPAGFVFPPAITGLPHSIPISYRPAIRLCARSANAQLQLTGAMTAQWRTMLLTDPSLSAVSGLVEYQQAINALYNTPGQAVLADLPPDFTFPTAITANIPISISAKAQLQFSGVMNANQKSVLLNDLSLSAVTGLVAYQQAINALFNTPGQPVLADMPPGFAFPASITTGSSPIPISITPVPLAGAITSQQRADLGALVSGNISYTNAIESVFNDPLLAVKFFDPKFSAPLDTLPAAVDFNTLADADLASRVSYDTEQQVLTISGILAIDEKQALDNLSNDTLYAAAVQSLFDQPRAPANSGDAGIWLLDADLQGTPEGVLATAIGRALTYLSTTLSQGLVVQQAAAQLGLSEALTRYLLTQYPVMTGSVTLLDYLTQTFAPTASAVEYTPSPQPNVFDGWFWASRAASLLKKWKIVVADLQKLDDPDGLGGLPAGAQLLSLRSLPFSNPPAIASLDQYLRTSRLLAVKDSLPETDIAFLDVLGKICAGTYTPATFAADVEGLNNDWSETDVAKLIDTMNGYGTTFPGMSNGYLLADNWVRLRRAFYFLDSLNATAVRVVTFAAPAMLAAETKTLKELLHSKFGAESWLALSADIQDALRERKRGSLAAYLLTLPAPADAPTGKWENSDDLFAYYLLDVEMCSCQLTSRLVRASGSVQLFVQRCFMGLEPAVAVKMDGDSGDSAWKWWTWMSKFQIWVANRKVFLWPEDWIRPELKSDTSSFFNDLKNELQQNEINSDNVETAFANYLEKLDGVARLEIAGFYQEDDGDDTILHVFGRTAGTEPHTYYYRSFDYRQWTPWMKVDLDIQGDYLVPAVLNGRLFLFWPVFTEVPDEESNTKVDTPDSNQTDVKLQRTRKKLRLQMAVSDYRRGKWSPRRISKGFNESEIYQADIVKNHYHFMAIDRTDLDGRFGIVYDGYSEAMVAGKSALVAGLSGAFELSGCDGGPAAASFPFDFGYAIQPEWHTDEDYSVFMKWIESSSRQADSQNSLDDFALQVFGGSDYEGTSIVPLLMRTPGLYQMSPPWHLSYMDRMWMQGQAALASMEHEGDTPLGSWLPFFYDDAKRTFLALPAAGGGARQGAEGSGPVYFYPDIKRQLSSMEELYAAQFAKSFESYKPPAPGTPERQQVEMLLASQFPQYPSPYSDDRLIALAQQYLMRWVQFNLSQLALAQFKQSRYQFRNFYHSFVCDFMRLVENPLRGIPALMARDNQLQDSGFSFKQTYLPTRSVIDRSTEAFYPREIVDFSPDGAYSSYNWELFFHAPLLIANSLSQNQKFEEARDWYHFIFNPIGVESAIPGGSAMSKYWITKPFYETADPQYVQQRIDNILNMLNGDAALQNQVRDWRNYPFDPHRIANYRTTAYQKTVVMNYLDNLIAWGDFLFRQDSMESIDQATQIYIMAAEILGPRPRKIPPAAKPPLSSFNELESSFDAFSNAMVQIENLIPQMSGNGSGGDGAPLPMLYFCIPQNDKLLGYWDTVADRLYKIDHCMNIEGVVRQLALFEPPIDPGALVKAAAGGVDISSALADLNAPLPLYRFNVLLQKANELCGDVKALGGALLSALEKEDSEALNLLRQSQEIVVLEATTAVKQQQVDEAKQNLEGTKGSRLVTEARRDFYRDIEQLTSQEKLHLSKMAESQKKQIIAQGIKVGASIMSLLPAINIGASGFGGTPLVTFKYGGLELGQAASAASDVISLLSQIAANDATMASIVAGNDRRWADWKLQENLADKELDQLDSQIAAGELRVTIAQKELDNHLAQIDNAKAVDAFMRSKYTNEELYQWQVGQISDIYFQSYKLAYDLAKRAERCFRFELGLQDSSYIKFGYWDSLKKGLLAGETLQYDLRRLDAAYLEQNSRRLELTKHVSLQMLDPMALIQLRETGRCFFQLPEELFDLDYPGHYFREIRSVSLTLPCVTGPYTTVSCTLRLLKNAIRIDTTDGDNGYPRNTGDSGAPANDTRFVEHNIPVQSIATSGGQNDSGVFELNFRDERYLPFEGAGAISGWSLELFNDPASADFGRALRQFDYETISDAILHIKYTAREDAGPFKARAVAHLNDYFSQEGVTTALRLFDMRHEFPSQWSRFTDPTTTSGNVLAFDIFPDLFRAVDAGKTLKINSLVILGRCKGTSSSTYTVDVGVPVSGWTQSATLAQAGATYGPLFFASLDVSGQSLTVGPGATPVAWQIALPQTTSAADFEDVLLVLGYEWE